MLFQRMKMMINKLKISNIVMSNIIIYPKETIKKNQKIKEKPINYLQKNQGKKKIRKKDAVENKTKLKRIRTQFYFT